MLYSAWKPGTPHGRLPNVRVRVDVRFGESIELAEANGLRSAVDFGRTAYPDRGLVTADIAGGMMAYAGPDSPFNQAMGIGFRAPLTQPDVDEIVDFYRSRNAAAKVALSPMANLEAPSLLARRGFTVEEYANVMALDASEIRCERDSRVETCSVPATWAYASAKSFADGAEPDDAMLFISELMAAHPGVAALMIRDKGEIAATACFALENGGIGALFAASTSPQSRGKGFQMALIRDRLARARESGATVVRAAAAVGSTSERNFRRYGFTPLYTRTTWALPRN